MEAIMLFLVTNLAVMLVLGWCSISCSRFWGSTSPAFPDVGVLRRVSVLGVPISLLMSSGWPSAAVASRSSSSPATRPSTGW